MGGENCVRTVSTAVFSGSWAPIATPDQIILVPGDFRGDIWLMELKTIS